MSSATTTPADARRLLLTEAREFSLRHACEDCVHITRRGTCSHGYPNESHLRAAVDVRGDIEFCKEFELA